MATITRAVLSGSSDGEMIPVIAVASPGTLIHTAHATSLDAIYLWASNVTQSPAKLTIEWGGVSDTADLMCKNVTIRPNSEPRPIVRGQTLTNSKVIRVFSGTANAINISGFISRIAP